MTKYKKEPPIVNARIWDAGSKHPKVRNFMSRDGAPSDIPNPPACRIPSCGKHMEEHGWIDDVVDGQTTGGWLVCPGDYVVDDGEAYYTCKPTLFERIYTKVTEASDD